MEKTKNRQPYYIGLDIGTSSVGWAVTDLDYRLRRFNRKTMWGVRLFEGAETAATRRTFRVNRRRLNRRKERLGLLKEFFAAEINKIGVLAGAVDGAAAHIVQDAEVGGLDAHRMGVGAHRAVG